MNRIKLFDTHTHMHDEWFDEDRHEAILRAYNSGVEVMVNIGTDLKSSYDAVALAEKYDFVYAAAGVHPHEASSYNEDAQRQLTEL